MRRLAFSPRWHSYGLGRNFPFRLYSANDGSILAGNELVPAHKKNEYLHNPIGIDTWYWVRSLASSLNQLNTQQSECLMTAYQQIATYRLHAWQIHLPTQTRLHQDLHLLRAISSELSRQHASMLGRLEVEQRTRLDRLTSELYGTIDWLRDVITNSRTDLALAVNAFKAESREDGQKLEMERHRLEGKLAAQVSRFRSEAENVKVRTVYSFGMVIFSVLLIVIVERSSSRKKGSVKNSDDKNEVLLLN